MDFLRSCYSTNVRFYREDPRECVLQWYFCEDDADDLGFGTCFTSNTWLDVPEGDQDLGEVPGVDRVWKNGLAPFPVAGNKPCGTEVMFQEGLAAPPATPVVLNEFGGLMCCELPPSPFLHYDCINCPHGAYNLYTLVSPPIAPTSLIFGLPLSEVQKYVANCAWDFTLVELLNWPVQPALGKWFFVIRPDGVYAGPQINGFFHPFFNSTTPWDCRTVKLVPVNASGIAAGAPSNVTLIPGIASGVGRLCPAWGVFLPDNLIVRISRNGPGLIDVILQQDAPFARVGPNLWRGQIIFAWRVPLLPFRGTVAVDATLTAIFPDLLRLDSFSPHHFPYAYESALPSWDTSPAALMLQPNPPLLLGLPQSVIVSVGPDLPP